MTHSASPEDSVSEPWRLKRAMPASVTATPAVMRAPGARRRSAALMMGTNTTARLVRNPAFEALVWPMPVMRKPNSANISRPSTAARTSVEGRVLPRRRKKMAPTTRNAMPKRRAMSENGGTAPVPTFMSKYELPQAHAMTASRMSAAVLVSPLAPLFSTSRSPCAHAGAEWPRHRPPSGRQYFRI